MSGGERGGDRALAQHADQRLLDEHRLVEQLVDLEARRGGLADRLQGVLDGVDDLQRRGVAVLDDAEQDRALAVLAHDILLHQPAVMHLADVLHEHRGAVHHLDRDVVQRVDRGGRGVGVHDILAVADLGGARGHGEVLGVDGVHDVERRQAFGHQLGGVDVDHDLAVLAAGRRRQGDAGDGGELLAHAVDAVVVELLLVQRVGGEADLQHRHARGVELHDDGRLDAGWHQGADRVGPRHDLGDREVEIDVGLEVDLLHREAGHGLGLDVLDAADVGRDGVLAVGGDALLHLGRAEPGVAPDHRHHRDLDLGEDVGAHGPGGDAAQEQDQRRRDVECVRKS